MRRDPTEFRKRFAKWKAGKRTKDIYRLGDQDYYEYMENLADKKATEWNDVPFKADPDILLIKMLNDNTYNYKEFYNTNRYEANGMLYANPDVHFTDSGKTVYHPTFSEESNYSGKKSDYNPEGIVGGSWTDSSFNVSPQLAASRYFSERRTKNYLKRNDPNIKLKLPKYADGTEGDDWYKYVQAGKNNEWSRITNDDMSQVFLDIVARPKSRSGNTTVGNWTRQWSPKYEKPLEIVSPEFDILTLGAGARINAATQAFLKNRKIANAIAKGIKENAIITGYNRNPVTKELGTLWNYQSYLDNVFPNSKIKDVLWHGSVKKNLLFFSPEYIGSNMPIKKSVGMYLAPEKTTAANYARKGDIYPVLLNTENPFITNQFFEGISKNGVNVAKISPKVRNTILAENDAVIAPARGEIAFFNPDDALILGSDRDVQGFRNFIRSNRTRLRKQLSKDGYVYENGGITPGEYKYYGRKPNYSNPDADNLSDYQLDEMLGDHIGRGAERTVYLDLRNSNRVLKITDGGSPDVQITNKGDLLDYIDESLRINNLPEVPRLSYEGFIKDENRYLPVFSLQKVTPLKKVADPFLIFTRQHVLPNGKTPSGKLSAIRRMNLDALSRIGYKPIPTKPGVYSVNGVGGSYNVTDLGLKNVGIDALGNLKIFDPMFE